MGLLRKKGDTGQAPTLAYSTKLTDHPDFAETQQRINAVSAARAKIADGIRDLGLRISATPHEDDYAARNVEAGLQFAETGVTQLPTGGISTLQEEHLQLRTQLDFVDRELGKLHEKLSRIQSARTAECYAANKAQHEDILRRWVAAMVAADAIVAEEEAFFGAMHAIGYWPTPPERAAWPDLGSLSDPNSMIASRLRALSKYIPN